MSDGKGSKTCNIAGQETKAVANNEKPKRVLMKPLSSPLRLMADIEERMAQLSDKDKGVVYLWFQANYGPNAVTMGREAHSGNS